MKLLLISDVEEPYLWDYYQPGRLSSYDIILSAGDLKPAYLRFLVTMANRPLFYIHGNHDVRYDTDEPEGCDCLDAKLTVCKGLRILGFGGSALYSGTPYQYTEKQMARMIRKTRRAVRRAGGVDIILTHAPPRGFGDGDDPAHRGFVCFTRLIEEYHPKYFIHGHQHLNYSTFSQRIQHYGDTTIINACGRYELEIDVDSEACKTPHKRFLFR